MVDDIKRIAFFVAHHNGLEEINVIETLNHLYKNDEDLTDCLICKQSLKWKNLLTHTLKKHQVKVNWNNIPIIKSQKLEKAKLSKALGKNEYVTILQVGSTGLGKNR